MREGVPQCLKIAPQNAAGAGAATSVITPPLGEPIVGGFTPFPAEHIHDELHARCLVLDDGKTKVALVVCDLLGMHRSVILAAKAHIESELSIPASHVLISATHTHSATIALGPTPRVYASDVELSDYEKFVARRIADGVRRAVTLPPAEAMRPEPPPTFRPTVIERMLPTQLLPAVRPPAPWATSAITACAPPPACPAPCRR